MTIGLPATISSYLDAKNARDVDAMLAPFDERAVVKDEGREYHGIAEIRAWLENVTATYAATFEAKDGTNADGRTIVSVLVSGNFPGSPLLLDFAFTLSGEGIARLEIT
ncbi:MAG TPA: nuclear transport factor 2 family protein [Candidatus Limnocylindria bacterium]|jgi:hypothetical protein|nr:nuclear transport factor 2 family protein [Candidatus Limnocylindria bacterium]